MQVDISRDMDVSDKSAAILGQAVLLQAFYNSNHDLEKNMCSRKRKRDRGSTDGASAASAHGEPVQKALK